MHGYEGLAIAASHPSQVRAPWFAPPRGLPREIGPLIGRTDDLRLVSELLERHRLVTIVGMYGVGKTRLASRHAWLEHQRHEVAVFYCDLVAVRTPEELVSALQAVLHYPTPVGEPRLEARHLGVVLAEHGPSLVVLDNFEHLVEVGAPLIAEWLGEAPEVRFLVTSRERLRVGEEVCVQLGPLSVDMAVELLAQRAQRMTPEFRVDAENLDAVTAICRQLDGLPLGIEMTAPWLQVLSADELAERLQGGLPLTHEGRPLGDRHASLESAIAWSWDLLAASEREFMAHVARFRGRFTLDDASAVVGMATSSPSVLTLLRRLRERSLIVTHRQSGSVRVDFSVPAAVRAFTAERRPEGPLAAAIDERYRARILELAGSLVESLDGPGAAAACVELERIRADLVAVASEGVAPARPALERALAAIGAAIAPGPTSRPAPRPATDARAPAAASEPPSAPVPAAGPEARLMIDARGDWFRVDGGPPVELGRRGPMRQILLGLIGAAIERPGEPLSLDAVRELGWPSERLTPDSAANRVYAALSGLRRLGLEPLIATRRGGWLIEPAVTITRVG